MKLSEHIEARGLTVEDAAGEIGGVSVSGLRKWVAGERVPRADQMRRIFAWSGGLVSPNDFVLEMADHDGLAARLASNRHGAGATTCPAKSDARLSQVSAQ